MIPDTLARSPYVSLVTHRRNGAPVATPVWAVADGDELLVWTREDSGKVKRLRNDPRVTLTPCDVRGRLTEGAQTVEGTARLLEGADALLRVRRALAGKYGLRFRLMDTGGALLRRGRRPHVGIAVRL
ncbi:PPOX class F420-dependent oxidoreductase [Streptomyces natalensis]|uniref:Pyridoxamine 5'-phosphate oxidase n=1 Tax=Streptomyces natalensis ATCC 27448 TaxID=1240678 RepID=A0A0D7CLU1_9ACTN|nr:PPOX class F420-dependent oxidoreductase [Streptomyces natalensis]KIZ17056.1 pyridoxamine 5'-phosphate oxidase [Streptomyces natalensis ATCC 27448]